MPDLHAALDDELGTGVLVGAGDSLVDLYADGYDSLAILPTYDGANDAEHVVFDIPAGRSLSIHGLGPAGVDVPSLEIHGAGIEHYGDPIRISGVRIPASPQGVPGLELVDCPNARVSDVVITGVAGDGLRLSSEDSDTGGSFSTTVTRVGVWNCAGHGIVTERASNPHKVTVRDCHCVANRGIGAKLRGSSWTVADGSMQLNDGVGLETRGGDAGTISGTYFEGNARANDYPVEMYVSEHRALSIQARFHGINPRSVDHDHQLVQRAISAHDAPQLSIRECSFLRYGDAALSLFDCAFADVHAFSHAQFEAPLLSTTGMGMDELLSGGMPWRLQSEFITGYA